MIVKSRRLQMHDNREELQRRKPSRLAKLGSWLKAMTSKAVFSLGILITKTTAG